MRRLLCGLPACALAGFAVPVWADDSSTQYTLEIEQQPIVAALTEFSRQTGLQVGYLPESPEEENTIAAPLKGQYTVESALKEMLKPSGLGFEKVNERTVSVGAVEEEKARRNRISWLERTAGARSDSPHWQLAGLMSVDSETSEDVRGRGESSGFVKVDGDSEKPSKGRRSAEVEEVIVTGSRIPLAGEGAQAVRVYDREDIERSGQTTVSGFLNGLPSVSLVRQEIFAQSSLGRTTVRLRGLPVGTTLVLLDGQRIETSGTMPFESVFDLTTIPIDAVERVEVLSSGTSIYGSDAIAGVVNIILKKKIDGLRASVRYGGASGVNESNASIALGHRWQRGSFSVTGTYQDRGELHGTERERTNSNDFRKFGGPNYDALTCHPGNVFFPTGFSFNGGPSVQSAAVPVGLTGTPSIAAFAATAGTQNTCARTSFSTIVPATQRTSVIMNGGYDLASSVSVFSDLLYSRVKQQHLATTLPIIGFSPSFPFTVPATNPYNPFGTTVAVSYAFPDEVVQDSDTQFGRALIGAKGSFGKGWEWEIASLHSQDWTVNPERNTWWDFEAIQTALNSSDPQTALNPFVDGPPGSSELVSTFFSGRRDKLEGRRQSVHGLVRGPILDLPAGAVELAFGGERARERTYSKQSVSSSKIATRTDTRSTAALFAEARVPVLSARQRRGDVLALTLAARYDDYSDFGSTINPQFAAEWRPLDTLLVRGTYAEAFRSPSLRTVNDPITITPVIIADPMTGQEVRVPVQFGGNPGLRPEGGQSETFGVAYSAQAIPGFRLALTHWRVEQTNTIQRFSAQAVVKNEASFPGRVVRDANGLIQSIDARAANFGGIEAAGVDYDISYQRETPVGTWSTSVSATQAYEYEIQLVPGMPPRSLVGKADSTGNWTPRWKGTAGLGWERGPYAANFTGRYVGRYQDYDGAREIGNFWLYDAHVRYEFGQMLAFSRSRLKGAHLELGAVNVFDTEPQYSNYGLAIGYDPAQADVRGRYLYLQIGAQL